MDDIFDHRNNGPAVHDYGGFITSRSWRKTWCYTNKGWFIYVRWIYGSDYWVALKDLKESNPAEVPEYVIAKNLCLNIISHDRYLTAWRSETAPSLW